MIPSVQVGDIQKSHILQRGKKAPQGWYQLDGKYVSDSGMFCREIFTLPPQEVKYYTDRIFAASQSSMCLNPIEFWIFDGDKFIGWAERYISSLDYCTKGGKDGIIICPSLHREVFSAHCQLQYDLTKLGYIETDLAPVNWAIIQGEIKTFDKDSVHSISRAADCFSSTGTYFKMAITNTMGNFTEPIKDKIQQNYQDPEFWKTLLK